jgi:hypothetical protein
MFSIFGFKPKPKPKVTIPIIPIKEYISLEDIWNYTDNEINELININEYHISNTE